MAKEPRAVSRRGLFGFLTKGLAEARDVAKEGLADVKGKRAKGMPSSPANPVDPPGRPQFEQRLRPASDTVTVDADAAGRITLDLRKSPIAIGGSLRVACVKSPLPLVLVRVNDDHYAVCAGACPTDASDVLWSAPQDVLWCPSCGSRWRLDGRLRGGRAP